MDDNQALQDQLDKLRGINSLLSAGEAKCDKCGATIRHLDRYCYNTLECPLCKAAAFDTKADRDSHFSQKHPQETPRGKRYCVDCSSKAGYLHRVRNRKTGEGTMAMFILRDEEIISGESNPA